MGFPAACSLTGFLLNVHGLLGEVGSFSPNLVTALIIAAGCECLGLLASVLYEILTLPSPSRLLPADFPVVSLLTANIVTERVSRLRNVLTVMGCEVKSYWMGQFIGDSLLLLVPALITTFVALGCAYSTPFPSGDDAADDEALTNYVDGGKIFWLLLFSSWHLIGFCFVASFCCPSAKVAIAFMPFFCVCTIFLPVIFVGIFWLGLGPQGADIISFKDGSILVNMLRGIAVLSPQVHTILAGGVKSAYFILYNSPSSTTPISSFVGRSGDGLAAGRRRLRERPPVRVRGAIVFGRATNHGSRGGGLLDAGGRNRHAAPCAAPRRGCR